MTDPKSDAQEDSPPLEDIEKQEKLTEPPVDITNIKDAKIVKLEAECSKLRDSWMRSVAEIENLQKRFQKDLEDSRKYAISGFAGDMVSVLENLKRAAETIPTQIQPSDSVENNPSGELLKNLGEGVNLTLKELLDIFTKYKIERIDPIGQKFDHNLHQAVAQVDDDTTETGTVVQVIQAGYKIADRLLRPAMVAVSKAPESDIKKLDTTV